jgi:hypothetical protein
MNSILFQRESALTTSTIRGHNRKLRKPAQESKGDKKGGHSTLWAFVAPAKKVECPPFCSPQR